MERSPASRLDGDDQALPDNVLLTARDVAGCCPIGRREIRTVIGGTCSSVASSEPAALMHRDHKLGLALGVLIVGFAAALCFPKQTDIDQRLLQLENPAELDADI